MMRALNMNEVSAVAGGDFSGADMMTGIIIFDPYQDVSIDSATVELPAVTVVGQRETIGDAQALSLVSGMETCSADPVSAYYCFGITLPGILDFIPPGTEGVTSNPMGDGW